jgi:hypothetical protein
MKNQRTLKAIAVITLSLIFITIASPSYAQGNGFVETFDDATLSGWEKDGDVIVESGILKMSPPAMLLKRGTWSNITLTAIFRFETEGFVVIDYYVSEGQHYSLTIKPTEIFLEKITGDLPERLWETSGVTLLEDWNTAKIGFDGANHSITLNDTLLATVADSSPLSSGGVRLHIPAGSPVEFDSIALQSQAGEGILPGEGQPGEAPPEGEAGLETGQEPPAEGETSTVSPALGNAGTTTGSDLTLLEEFFSSQASNLELSTFAINLLLAVITSFILSRVYIHWGSSLSNRRVFAANFMLMTVTTTFIILVVRSSVALSLGLVGALSIVRFRAAVKEPEELAYLFFAIGLGIGLGDNQRLISLLTLLVAIILAGLMNLFRNTKADVNLHLTISSNPPNKVSLDQIMNVLEKHCAKMKLLRFDENAESLETSFVIEFKKVSNLNRAKAELQTLSDTLEISFLDNRGIW